jgi:malonyl CoA-acyl carrier protein transacylase
MRPVIHKLTDEVAAIGALVEAPANRFAPRLLVAALWAPAAAALGTVIALVLGFSLGVLPTLAADPEQSWRNQAEAEVLAFCQSLGLAADSATHTSCAKSLMRMRERDHIAVPPLP